VRIREARPPDAKAMIALLTASFEGYREFAAPGWEPPFPGTEQELALAGMLGEDRVWWVVAEDEDGLAGQCSFTPAHTRRQMQGDAVPGMAHLLQLFIRPDLWGSGLAADLHGRAVVEMRARGYTRARLLTPEGQARARAFYERRGWRPGPVSLEDPVDLNGLPVIEYRLEL
jgi:GNAT superfamily N-acetyltransferase